MDSGNESKEFAAARVIAFRYLKFRPRSEKEIVEKLKDKNVAPEIIQKTVEFLKQHQFIDDPKFARAWISARLKKPLGMMRIRQELKQKGISDEIIAQETPPAQSDYDETATISALARRRMQKYREIDKLKAKRRTIEYLLRRGFSFEAIRRGLKES